MTAATNDADFRTVHYADDITRAHTEGLTDFLITQIDALREEAAPDTHARRASAALNGLVGSLRGSLRSAIQQRDELAARGVDTDWAVGIRHDVLQEWNRLVALAEEWRDVLDGYQYAPWHLVEYINAEAEEAARQCAARQAATAEDAR